MEKFVVLAWLPSLPYFVAKDESGQMGWLTPKRFTPTPDWFFLSATQKYGYIPVEPNREITMDQIEPLFQELEKERTTQSE